MHKREFLKRYTIVGALFIFLCAVFVIRLVNLQITGANFYTDTKDGITVREVKIEAQRGEIYDVNGELLVRNLYAYDLYLEAGSFPQGNGAANNVAAAVSEILSESDIPLQSALPIRGVYPNVSFDPSTLETAKNRAAYRNFLSRYRLDEEIEAIDLYEFLLEKYGIISEEGDLSYSGELCAAIVGIRYDLEALLFDVNNPYLLAKNVDLSVLTKIEERVGRGYQVTRRFERQYLYPGYASHILGRVGRIQAGEEDAYLAAGYELDDIVGIDGVEKAFDLLLRGKNGIRVIEEDAFGNVVNSYIKEEAVPGKDIYLTIDIGLQIASEKALEANVLRIIEIALASGQPNNGQNVTGGGLCVLDTKTGAVRAMASYPTYNLETFFEDYESNLLNEHHPFLNRALQGALPPGSTFKVGTAAAALTNGIITKDTLINDTGRYRYYQDYQPSCWYLSGHGNINVVHALGVSCNYYFFDVGRQLGITALNDYFKGLGIGQPTGIELPESVGILAGPEYNEISGKGPWNPGDTLAAAIGQSDNMVTPTQLASYISAVLNGGVRNSVHILDHSCNYDGTGASYYVPQILSTVPLSPSTLQIVKEGMREVATSTSTLRRYKFPIGAKTGTSQTSTANNNAVFTAFAPYDDPEITVAAMFEYGGPSIHAVYGTLDIFNYYFNLNSDGSEKTPQQLEAEAAAAEAENGAAA